MNLIEKLRYMGRQYAAGQQARGGGTQKHYLEEAADEIERLTTERDALVAAIQESLPSTMIPAMETLTAAIKGKTVEIDALRLDAERYRYLRNRVPAEVLCNRGIAAGCWIDYEDEKGDLILLTRDDADAAIDAAMKEKA